MSLEKSLLGRGADPGFLINISPEDTAWHGMPGEGVLRSGEIVTIDIACSVRGWWADAARTFPVGIIDQKRKNLLETAWNLTRELVAGIREGENGSGTSALVSELTGASGVSLLTEGAGHGIGRRLHELPSLTYDGRIHDPMRAGRLYTVEPVISPGNGRIGIYGDGSARTEDGEPVAHFEVTFLLIQHGTQILGSPEWINHSPC